MFSSGDAETQNSIFKICIKVVKYAVKIVQNTAGMCDVMVSSICGIVYKNVTSGTRKGIQEWKQACEMRYQLSEWPKNTFLQANLVLIPRLVLAEIVRFDVKR